MSPHLRGHLLLFDTPAAAACSPSVGARLLASAVLLEALRLAMVAPAGPLIPRWLLFPLLLALAIAALRLAGVSFAQIGLPPWREWTRTEQSYFLQVIVIANVVFPLVLGTALSERFAVFGAVQTLATVFVPYLFYGFYQEVVYRGMVQSELIRRMGTAGGILGANVLYTFGPLHSYYWTSYAAQALPMFAAVFAIGLLFGVLYRRSGNLWIVAVMHAIGNAYMVASMSAAT